MLICALITVNKSILLLEEKTVFKLKTKVINIPYKATVKLVK